MNCKLVKNCTYTSSLDIGPISLQCDIVSRTLKKLFCTVVGAYYDVSGSSLSRLKSEWLSSLCAHLIILFCFVSALGFSFISWAVAQLTKCATTCDCCNIMSFTTQLTPEVAAPVSVTMHLTSSYLCSLNLQCSWDAEMSRPVFLSVVVLKNQSASCLLWQNRKQLHQVALKQHYEVFLPQNDAKWFLRWLVTGKMAPLPGIGPYIHIWLPARHPLVGSFSFSSAPTSTCPLGGAVSIAGVSFSTVQVSELSTYIQEAEI